MKISNTAATIKPSPTRRLFNLAQSIPNVIDLTLGDPDMPPEKAIKEAAGPVKNHASVAVWKVVMAE